MALFIAKAPTYSSKRRVPAHIGGRNADLRPSGAENQAINRLGDLLRTRADEMKKERDAAVVGEMYNKWRDADRQQLTQLGSKKGRDAVNLDKDYNEFFTKSINKAHESAENGSQQAMIADKMSRRREHSLDSLAQYEAAEGKRYKIAQADGLFKNAVESGREGRGDEGIIQAAIAEDRVSIINAHQGIGEEEKEALFRSHESAIRFASYQSQADGDPVGALANIEKYRDVLGEGYHKLKAKAKPISNAYTTDAIVAKAMLKATKSSPDAPFDIGPKYDEVKRLTTDPTIRQAAFLELSRMKKIHDGGVKEKFDYYFSAISSTLQNNKNANINDIEKMPEFNYLPEAQQDVARAKAQKIIDQRDRAERTVAASERSAAAADRAVDSANRASSNQAYREQQRAYDTKFNAIMGNERSFKALETMSDDDFNALLLDVGDKNQAKLLNERLKLKEDNRYYSASRQRIEIVNDVLRAANITDESDKALYMEAVTEYVGSETDIVEIKRKVAEAMQNAVLKKPWLWTNSVEITPPKDGKRFVGTKDGKNVYERPDGRWQIGE